MPLELRDHLRPGMAVWWPQAGGEPAPLVDELLAAVPAIGPVRAFAGVSWNPRFDDELPDELTLLSYGALGRLRGAMKRGRIEVISSNYSTFPRLFATGALPNDLGLVQVSPPDDEGMVTLGVSVDYTADALLHTSVLVAEVNAQMPATRGGPRLPLERFAAYIETDRPLLARPHREPDDVDQRIAAHVADLIEDGDTLQLGIGTLPTAVLQALGQHRELGLHSGMVTDAALDLVEAGVVTGARKERDAGLAVAGLAMCSAAGYRRLADLPVELRPTSHTHDPAVLAGFRRLVAVNAALEVDLLGQVGSEVAGGSYVGALGGQVDFSHAAAVSGARSIIVVRSTAGRDGRPAIVPRLPDGVVSTPRSDVDAVVTEHGVAILTGGTPAERARRLVAIAAPGHRADLERVVR